MEKIEGYLFWTSGYEHGPTIMIREDQWIQDEYEKLDKDSWCSNEFYGIGEKNWANDVKFELKPGIKYRLTIEEIPDSEESSTKD